MSWYDPWDELAYFQSELLEMLDDKLGSISEWAMEIWQALRHEVTVAISWAVDKIADIGSSIGGAIGEVIQDLIEGFDWIFDGLFDSIVSVFQSIGETLDNVYRWLKDGVSDAVDTIGGFISGIWDGVKEFLSGQYDKITRFWYDIFSDLYFYLDLALTDLWTYFVDVVIPVFMGALGYVAESAPVKYLIGLFETHILAAFTALLDIDEEDLQSWIQKSFAYMKSLAEGVKE